MIQYLKKPLEMVKALMEGRKDKVAKEATFVKQKEKKCFFLLQKKHSYEKKQKTLTSAM